MAIQKNPYFIRFYRDNFPSYEEFYENIMKKNICCMFDEELTKDWPSRHEWINPNGSINYRLLEQRYGSLTVPVYNCSEKYFNSNPKEERKFSDFLNYWKGSEKFPILYLKDWHLAQDSGNSDFYQVPIYFESDYLNEYCINNGAIDFRFTYMGPERSNTPLHTDVFGSFSWSANVCGRKKWLMIPASNISKLKQLVGDIPHDLYDVPDHQKIIEQVEGFEIIQEAGQVVFVPSGMLHQVINLENTISINHNWFNACNLDVIYKNLIEAFYDVQNEIIDLKSALDPAEWIETCDRILTIHFGMNLEYFYQIIRHIAKRLLQETSANELSFRHRADIECIKNILSDKIFPNKDFSSFMTEQDRILLSKLNHIAFNIDKF